MVVACWSSKGGAGTTVVAGVLAVLYARRAPHGALIADLAGDVPAGAGAPRSGWSRDRGLARGRCRRPHGRAEPVGAPRGRRSRGPAPWAWRPPAGPREVLAALLGTDARPVIADCGTDPSGVPLTVAASATRSIFVTRPCFLSLRRAMAMPLRPSEVVLLSEPGRALTRADVEDCVGAPVVAEVAVDPQVARAVDAGLLATRLPRALAREVGRAA